MESLASANFLDREQGNIPGFHYHANRFLVGNVKLRD
jgi:hypothetical protein